MWEILTPSPNRIRPVCPYAGECPGCSYAHVGYATELEWKQKQFERFLVHPGLVDPAGMRKPVPADRRTGWRNKIRLTVEKSGETVRTGYRMEDNRTVLDIRNCLLACPEIARMMEKKLGDREFRSHLPEGTSFPDVPLYARGRRDPAGGGGGGAETKVADGYDSCLRGFLGSRASFFQINPGMASRLGEEFLRIVRKVEPELFLELYCGCGVFSALAAEAGGRTDFRGGDRFGIGSCRIAESPVARSVALSLPGGRRGPDAGSAAASSGTPLAAAGRSAENRTGAARDRDDREKFGAGSCLCLLRTGHAGP